MANIGSFKKSGNEFQGEIVTLSVQTKGVRIAPEVNRSNDNAPTTGSTWAGLRSGPPGRSAPTRVAIISRSVRRPELQCADLRQPLRRRGRRGLHPHLVAHQAQRRLSRIVTSAPARRSTSVGAVMRSSAFSGVQDLRFFHRRSVAVGGRRWCRYSNFRYGERFAVPRLRRQQPVCRRHRTLRECRQRFPK
jgi:hypothetical protein